jgi:autotransporter-associated beta strand protein
VIIFPGGTLQVQGGIALPDRISVNGGTGATNATGAVESVSGNNTLMGGVNVFDNTTVSADAGSTLTVSTKPVTTNNNNKTLTVNAIGAVAVSSVVQGTVGSALTKTGAGTLTLAANNTYTGPTTVNAGTLLVNGSQPSSSMTVASGATLGGTGTTGPVTANGTVSPGVGGPGVLQSGNIAFNLGSTFAVDLDGTTAGSGYDELFATGPVTLAGPTLAVSVGFASTTGNAFTILQTTGSVSGGFLGLADGSTFASGGRTFRINYTTNAVTLTDVTPAATATPTPTATPTSCILGDINCDGIVDIRDYGIWRQNFGQTNCGNPADLDGNCIVDIRDYGIWRANFGHTAGPAPAGGAPAAGATPALRRTPSPTPATGRVTGAHFSRTEQFAKASDDTAAGSWPRLGTERSGRAVPVIPKADDLTLIVGDLLALGGPAGWGARRPLGSA